MIRARTKGALAVKRRRGERIGTIPYGSKLGPDGVRLIPEPSEQKIVKLVRRLRDEGLSLRVIAAELDARGLRPRRGKRWYPTTIKKIVERTPNPKGSR
jgi:DNA invertase Pin-like site-specific DNA recombinase